MGKIEETSNLHVIGECWAWLEYEGNVGDGWANFGGWVGFGGWGGGHLEFCNKVVQQRLAARYLIKGCNEEREKNNK